MLAGNLKISSSQKQLTVDFGSTRLCIYSDFNSRIWRKIYYVIDTDFDYKQAEAQCKLLKAKIFWFKDKDDHQFHFILNRYALTQDNYSNTTRVWLNKDALNETTSQNYSHYNECQTFLISLCTRSVYHCLPNIITDNCSSSHHVVCSKRKNEGRSFIF